MALSLRIQIMEKSVTKTLQFDPSTTIFDACKIIRDKCSELPDLGQAKDYGLFLPGEAYGSGAWLEPGKTLDYYLLRNGDTIEYRRKIRTLRVRTLDGVHKTLLVDDSQVVSNLMVVICTKMGITNHDEYSLVRELPEENDIMNTPNYGTLTLRRKKEEREKDAKMDQLRKKLKTDDEINWVDHTKTLREQGIEEGEVLLLRRKYFFSDQNIDSHDPVQLNLLYVQARDAILEETHPITQAKACEFAGIQCQIQVGDYNAQKHRPGYLDLKDFLPVSYIKSKGVEKRIFTEHAKHSGLSELDAKALYAKNARALDTYGVTFFLVKEKMPGRNKLVPRLLGVTKDSVLRLDERTKDIMETWPLTTVRRWAASPNTFTLDFGDYSAQYYSVQTPEGEQIAQLIAGYIDIILKKKQAKDHLGIEGDEGSTLFEEIVSPFQATTVQRQMQPKPKSLITDSVAKPAIIQSAPEGISQIHTGQLQREQFTTTRGQLDVAHSPQPPVHRVHQTETMTRTQQSFLSGKDAIARSQECLDTPFNLPPIGDDKASQKWKEATVDTKKQNVHTQIAAMNSSVAHMVSVTSSEEIDGSGGAVDETISAISSGLPEVAKDMRMLAALMDENGEKLIVATKKLCFAFTDLLNAAEPGTKEPRQNFLTAAGRVGEASRFLLSTIDEGDESQELLLKLAKDVANSTAKLVVQAKHCSNSVDDTQQKELIIQSASQAALSASELVACAKVVAATIQNDRCRNELMSAIRKVAQAVEAVLSSCNTSNADKGLKGDLQEAARDVSNSLNRLLDHIRPASRASVSENLQEGAVDTILVATDKIISSDDSADMLKQARILAQATAQLIKAIKGEADRMPDSDQQKKLIAAAKLLADATTKLAEAAKCCASNPQAPVEQDLLRQAAVDVREATNVAAGGALQRKSLRRLESSAKNAAAAATQCIASSQSASTVCSNPTSKEQMSADCRAVADTIPTLVSAVKSSVHTGDDSAQMNLVEATERFISPSISLVTSTKNASTFLGDPNAARHLMQCSQKLAVELVELRTALDRMKADSGVEHPTKQLEVAGHKIREAKEEIIACRKSVARNELKPLPGDTLQNAILRLTVTLRKISTCTEQLVDGVVSSDSATATSASQGISTGINDLVQASRAVATTTGEPIRVFNATEEALERCWILLSESKVLLGSPGVSPEERDAELQPIAHGVQESLLKIQSSIPGQREVEEAIQNITSTSLNLENTGSLRRGRGKNYGQLQNELAQLGSNLEDTTFEVVGSTGNPTDLGQASSRFSERAVELLNTGSQLAALHEEIQVREEILLTLKSISIVSSNLLVVAKGVSTNPGAPGARNQLNAASRAVSESINQLMDACSSSAPGQKECENAIRKIQGLKGLLDNPSEPINNHSYFDCHERLVERTSVLGESMTGIGNYAKDGRLDQFGKCVNSCAESVSGLIETCAQAAYLLGASDPTSIGGRPGLVDIHAINQSAAQIKTSCQTLLGSNVKQPQVLGAATLIAQHTSALCTASRNASERTNDQTTKRQFVQLAKEVANATAILVREIKTLEPDQSLRNRDTVSRATNTLIRSVNSLVQYSSLPEFAAVPAKISSNGRHVQQPIIISGRGVIEGMSSMLETAKSLVLNPTDPPTWLRLAHYSKQVSDSIKGIVTAFRENAPGQAECEVGIQRVNSLMVQLNQAHLSAVSQSLTPKKNNTLRGFVENAENSVRAADEHVGRLRQAGRCEAESLGHETSAMVVIMESMVTNILGVASNIVQTKEQVNIIERSKTVLECVHRFLLTAKETGGNPKAISLHQELDASVQGFQEGLDDLKTSLERISSGAGGFVSSITESIAASMVRMDQKNVFNPGSEAEGYVDFQTRMVNASKDIARLSQDMVSKASVDPAQIPGLSSEISRLYIFLANDARGAVATTISPDIGIRIRCGVQELGRSLIDLVRCGGSVQFSPNDAFAQRDLSDANRSVSEKVSDILAALQAGSHGTQTCINAASTVSGIIGDLDTTIMFATAGTLHAEGEETFADHRENIIRTAKALVEDTKALVAGAAAPQEQLAMAANSAVSTIVQLSEAVKFGAASLGSKNPESQVMLINSVRDVAGALYDLIHSTKSAAGKPESDTSLLQLKESGKIMVTNVTSLLKAVQAVEDEHTRGTRALEATIEAIAQEIRAYESLEIPRGRPVTAEELVRVTKPVTVATSKAVAAGASCRQDDVIVAANMGRKAISDLLTSAKSGAVSVDGELRERLIHAARQVAVHYRELLQFVLQGVNHAGTDVKPQLANSSREIATSLSEMVAVGQLMKVLQNQVSANPLLGHALRSNSSIYQKLKGNEFEDPDDPTVIAENELLGAANSIDAAAKKLEKLRPRRSVREADESLNFDEMILEAAKSIAAATSALVKAASAAQRELVDTGRVSRKMSSDSDDGQWAEGLVSAAQMVAAATHTLVEAANLLVQGHATEEKLISAAKQVASSTAQLLVACKVKASPDSDSTRRLHAAGNAVIRATDNLVKAAKQALSQEEEHQLILHQKKVGSIKQVIDARADVLRIEKELEDARKRLADIHRAKYQDGGSKGGDGEVEIETVRRHQDSSRLDSLLESSADRVHSANNSFSIVKLQQSPSPKSPSSKHPWIPFVETMDMFISRQTHDTRPGLFVYKVNGYFDDISPIQFLETQLDLDYRKEWDSSVEKLDMIESNERNQRDIIHWEVKWPMMLSNRDYCYARKYVVNEELGTICIMSKSVQHPNVPAVEGVVRVNEYWSVMHFKGSEGLNNLGVEFRLTYYDNPEVSLPQGLLDWASKKAPDFLNNLRNAARAKRKLEGTKIYAYRKGETSRHSLQPTSEILLQFFKENTEVLRIEAELDERNKIADPHKSKNQEPRSRDGVEGRMEADSTRRSKDPSRLDSLLESSAERVHSATNSFSIMKLQSSPTKPGTIKPHISPKPGTSTWEKKSTSHFVVDSTPLPPQTQSGIGNGTYPSPSKTKSQQTSNTTSPVPPITTMDTPGSVTAARRMFMKPSEFLPTSPKSTTKILPGGISHVTAPTSKSSSFTTTDEGGKQEVVEFEFSSTGPIHSEQIIESSSTGDSSNISLKRIFQQQETRTTSKVTSTRKIFQQKT